MTQPRNILIIQTAFIGDAILATSVAESLHQSLADAKIDLLVRAGNESLFANHPFLNVLVWEKNRHKYGNLLRVIRRVRRQKYDLIVNLHRFASSGWVTVFSGAHETRGYTKNPLARWFSKTYPHLIGQKGDTEFLHEIERNYALISDWCSNLIPPKLYPERAVKPEQQKALNTLTSEPYYCIAPASVWNTKAYPEEKWVELVGALPEAPIHFLGSAGDGDLAGRIIRAAARPNTFNQCGKFNLNESALLMQGAAMNYVNDSAPLHLCSAVNAPVTAVFCSTIPEFGFGPVRENGKVVQSAAPLDCRPCGLHGKRACPEGHFRCATTIQVEQLTQE